MNQGCIDSGKNHWKWERLNSTYSVGNDRGFHLGCFHGNKSKYSVQSWLGQKKKKKKNDESRRKELYKWTTKGAGKREWPSHLIGWDGVMRIRTFHNQLSRIGTQYQGSLMDNFPHPALNYSNNQYLWKDFPFLSFFCSKRLYSSQTAGTICIHMAGKI